MEYDVITLSSAHSCIMGNKPKKISLEMVGEKQIKEKRDITSLGLFDNSTPNYTTYYPDVTVEDLEPAEEDFIYPTFRMLSMVTVHKNWNPISFERKWVLRKSMEKLIGQTVNIDHETALGNAVGVVQSVSWQNAYTTDDGVEVPAGINAVLKIDGKSNPRIARGIMMDPPSIHSNSVTVNFAWEQSHPNMDRDEFWNKLGTYDEDGKMITREVSDIKAYQETSLVAHGADSFAKQIREGKIVNPSMANDNASLSANFKGLTYNDITLDFGRDLVSLSATPSTSNNQNSNTNSDNMKDALIKLAKASGFKFEGEEPDLAALMAHIEAQSNSVESLTGERDALTAEKDALKTSNEELTAEKVDLNKQVNELTEKVENLEPQVTKLHDDNKKEAVRLYKLAMGDKALDSMVDIINNADAAGVEAFAKQFGEEVENKFGATCGDCGSTNLTRKSTNDDQDDINLDDQSGKDGEKTTLSDEEILEKYGKSDFTTIYTEKEN